MIRSPLVTPLRTAHVRGFTLIEQLIVVLIIIILAGLIISLIGPLREMVKISTTSTRIAAIHQGRRGGRVCSEGLIRWDNGRAAAQTTQRLIVSFFGSAVSFVPSENVTVSGLSCVL